MSETAVKTCNLTEEDQARAGMYGLLARLLSAPPNSETLEEISTFPADETPIGACLGDLAVAAREGEAAMVKQEYDDLFIGVTEGELIPFASHYLTGFLNEKPLADLRDDLNRLGIERSDSVKEPEDHIAFLLDVMVGLVTGELAEKADDGEDKKFFEKHLEPWAEKFFNDLEKAKSTSFYGPVAKLGLCFLDVETKGFRIAP